MTRTTMAFLLASVGTLCGAILAVWLLDLSTLEMDNTVAATSRDTAIAGLFTATYIGGSINYAALGEITGLRSDASFFSAATATATDNLFSALYLTLLSLLPIWNWLAGRYLPRILQQANVVHAVGQITTLTLGLSLALGGCPRID